MKMLGLGLGMALGLAKKIKEIWWQDNTDERVSSLIKKKKKKNCVPGVPFLLPPFLCDLDVVA